MKFLRKLYPLGYSKNGKEEWKAVRFVANDRDIVIKKADKGSCVVIWDRSDYIMEAEKQLNDKAVYKDVNFDKDLIPNLTAKSNRLFENIKRRQLISISVLSLRKLVICCICCLKSTNDYQMYLEDQSFQIAERLQKKYPNF